MSIVSLIDSGDVDMSSESKFIPAVIKGTDCYEGSVYLPLEQTCCIHKDIKLPVLKVCIIFSMICSCIY